MKKISKRLTISCGIILVRFENGTPLYLMLRSYSHWDFPKGKMEKGESFIDAAIRETEEETCIDLKDIDFKWGYTNKDTSLYKKGTKYAKYFVAETNKQRVTLPVVEKLGRAEHDEYRWVTFKQGKKLAGKGFNVRNLKGGILAWTHAKGPLVDPNGNPTTQVHTYGTDWNLLPPGYQATW